jgi:hypothetical protein
MAETDIGTSVATWSTAAKADLKQDLDKLTKVPLDVLRPLVEKIAKTLPACNPADLVALEAEEKGIANSEALSDVISSLVFIFENADEGESPQSVVNDLTALGLLSNEAAPILTDLLKTAAPFREGAKAQASYIRIGAPLFVTLRGVLDVRLRFHKKREDFVMGAPPTSLAGTQRVIVADLTLQQADGREEVVSFTMDESDLGYMKRFVRHMERELELSKGLVKESGAKTNG